MKNLAIISVLVLFFSYCQTPDDTEIKKTENALMPKNQRVYYAPLIKSDSMFGLSLAHYQKEYFDFTSYIIDKALKGEIKVYQSDNSLESNYDTDNEPAQLSLADIKKQLGMGIQTISYEDQDGNTKTQTTASEYRPEEIVRIGFLEDWFLKGIDFTLTKKILKYDLVRKYSPANSDEIRYLKVFSVIPNDSIKPHWELACSKVTKVNIWAGSYQEYLDMSKQEKSEFVNGFVTLDNDCNSFWNSYTFKKFVNLLFDGIKSGKLKVFDFSTKKEIGMDEVEKRMGAGMKTISYMDQNGDYVAQTIKMDVHPEEIWSVLFIEDWYFDKSNLALKKVIKGIAPVRHYYQDDVGLKTEVVCVIFFNQNP